MAMGCALSFGMVAELTCAILPIWRQKHHLQVASFIMVA